MLCPKCGMSNPSGKLRCVCGHEFAKGEMRMDSQPDAPSQPPQTVRRLSFHGDTGTLFGIYIVNLFLTVITLGVYYFWGKVKVRNYLYSQTEVEGDRFAYHGTGKELFVGWIKAVVCIWLILGITQGVGFFWKGDVATVVLMALFYLAFLFVVPVAIVYSQRYWLSRTSWRGIRFSFRGGVKEFMKIYVAGTLLSIVTLGFYYPYFQTNTRKFQIEKSYFGNTPFRFDGRGGDIFWPYVKAILLSVLTFGVYWFWFSAWRHRYYWEHTYFSTARFRSTVTGGPLFGLKLVNVLLLVVSFGLAWPWITVRNARFIMERLTIEGQLDIATIQQEAQDATSTGEGFTELLDIDALSMSLGV